MPSRLHSIPSRFFAPLYAEVTFSNFASFTLTRFFFLLVQDSKNFSFFSATEPTERREIVFKVHSTCSRKMWCTLKEKVLSRLRVLLLFSYLICLCAGNDSKTFFLSRASISIISAIVSSSCSSLVNLVHPFFTFITDFSLQSSIPSKLIVKTEQHRESLEFWVFLAQKLRRIHMHKNLGLAKETREEMLSQIS